MAMKKKITKAEFEKLAKHFQEEYKAEGDGYVLDVDGEEDLAPLKNANTRLKEEKAEAKRLLKEAQEKLEALEEGDNKTKGNIEALEKSWKGKLDTQATESKAKIDKLAAALTNTVIGGQAQKLASELSPKSFKLLIPFIEKRLQADLEGDEPKMRILDAAGKPSALTMDDLKKEFIDNADFSAIIVGSKATGGAGADKTKTGGAAPDNKPVNLATVSPKQLAEHIKAKKSETT